MKKFGDVPTGQPGLMSPPGKSFRPNMRDTDVHEDPQRRITTTTQFVQNFGGKDLGYWRGRDVSARADRIAPAMKGEPKSPAPNISLPTGRITS